MTFYDLRFAFSHFWSFSITVCKICLCVSVWILNNLLKHSATNTENCAWKLKTISDTTWKLTHVSALIWSVTQWNMFRTIKPKRTNASKLFALCLQLLTCLYVRRYTLAADLRFVLGCFVRLNNWDSTVPPVTNVCVLCPSCPRPLGTAIVSNTRKQLAEIGHYHHLKACVILDPSPNKH
jgi:hypothetical protein